MKVTVSFANPFLVAIYTITLLMIGFAIGGHWGHTLIAGWMLLFATCFLLIHDCAIAVLLAIAATKVASSGQSTKPTSDYPGPESRERTSREPHAISQNPTASSVLGEHLRHLAPRQYLDLSIEEMEFSVRTYGCLKTADIQTVRALVRRTEGDLTRAGFPPKVILEIKVTLEAIGLRLRHRKEGKDSQS